MKTQAVFTTLAVLIGSLSVFASYNPAPLISGVSVTAITTDSATITWKTNKLADSQVAYGLSSSYGSLTPLDPALVLSHSQTLSGLQPNTTYHFQVRSTPDGGSLNVAGDFVFATSPVIVPGMITGSSVSDITATSARVSWTTTVPASSIVDYGFSTSYIYEIKDPALTTSHAMTLTALRPASVCHFQIKGVDAAGGVGMSADQTITTPSDGSPGIFSGISATAITSSSATISWNTGVPTVAQVEYGMTTAYGSLTAAQDTYVTSRSALVSGLTASTLYHYRVRAVDLEGTVSLSADYTFTTAPTAVTVAISGVSAALVRIDSATIVWTSSPAADSQVEYGITGSYGSATMRDPTLSTSHSVVLNGLVPDTLYHFRVRSAGLSGDPASSGDFTFTTAQLSLFYPQLGIGADDYTGIALVDLGLGTATTRFTAIDGTGAMALGNSLTNPVTKTLNAGVQLPVIDDQLFGPGVSGVMPRGWREIDSSSGQLTGLFMVFDSSLTRLDGAEITGDLLSSFVFPEVGDQDYTLIVLGNPSSTDASVTLDLVALDGTLRSRTQLVIPGYAAYSADLRSTVFAGITVDPSDYVRVSSSENLLPYVLFGTNSGDFAIVAGQDPNKGSAALYSPQYAVGGAYRSTLSLVNLDPTPGTVNLAFMGDDGLQIGNTRTLSIAGGGKIFVSDQAFFQGASIDPSQLIQGYVKVISDGVRLSGNVVYSATAQGAFSTALPLVSSLRQSVVLGHVASNDTYFTGLSILNPNETDTSVTIDLYDSNGQLEGTFTQSIGGGQRTSRLLTEYFPALVGQDRHSGYIRISADQNIACFGVFGTSSLSVLSAIPAQPLP